MEIILYILFAFCILKFIMKNNSIELFSGCIKTIDISGYTQYPDRRNKEVIKQAILDDFVGNNTSSYLKDPNALNNNIRSESCTLNYLN